jgi:hypothetical protein
MGPNLTDRNKQGVKCTLLTEASRIPMALAIDEASCHHRKWGRSTLDNTMIRHPLPTEIAL